MSNFDAVIAATNEAIAKALTVPPPDIGRGPAPPHLVTQMYRLGYFGDVGSFGAERAALRAFEQVAT